MGLELEYKITEDIILGKKDKVPYLIYIDNGYAIRITESNYKSYFNPGHFLQTTDKELQTAKDIVLDDRRLLE